MKAKLEFNMDDPDDRVRHLQCVKVVDVLCAVQELSEHLRRAMKDADDARERLTAQYWRDVLNEELSMRGVDLDELLP